MSVVYFIQRDSDKAIKIGYSTNLAIRIQTLKSQHGKLELMAWIEGDIGNETALHQMFDKYRLDGEWFSPVGELKQWIKENACDIHLSDWSGVIFEMWKANGSETESIAKKIAEINNQILQAKFDYLVALDCAQMPRASRFKNQTFMTLKQGGFAIREPRFGSGSKYVDPMPILKESWDNE